MASLNSESRAGQLAWFAGVAATAFLLPFIFYSTLDLQHDLYYFVYFSVTLAALAVYVTASHINFIERLKERWQLSIGVGVLAAAFVVWSVLGRIDSTPHPTGAYFASRSSGVACCTVRSTRCC